MDIFKLEYFVVAYESASFSDAAQRLYVSRQAVRHAIRSLEGEVGCALFTVKERRLLATPEAARLYNAAIELLGAYRRFEMQAACLGEANPIALRWGQSVGINDVFDPDELRLRRHGPIARRMHVTTCSCEQCREGLRSGDFDSVSIVTDRPEGDSEFRCKCVRCGRLYLLVSRLNPLAEKAVVTIDDLKGEPFITQGPEYDLHTLVASAAAARGFALNVVYSTPSMFEIVDQVDSNCGVSYYPTPEVRIYGSRDVVCIPFAEEGFRWYLQAMIARQRVPSELCYRIWETAEGVEWGEG